MPALHPAPRGRQCDLARRRGGVAVGVRVGVGVAVGVGVVVGVAVGVRVGVGGGGLGVGVGVGCGGSLGVGVGVGVGVVYSIVSTGGLVLSRVSNRFAVAMSDSSPNTSQPKLLTGLSSHDCTSPTIRAELHV